MEPFYYTKMTKQQQAAYHVIMQGANALADEFQIPRIESAELYDVFFRLRLDHPEIFWMTGYKYKYYQDSPNLIFVPEYLFDKNKIREHQRAMSSRVEKLARAAKDLSEWEKEKYIHDFICDNVTYDKLKKAYSHEIIGPLGHGVGVCEGIAKSVKVLCDALGIWCMIAVCGNNPEIGIFLLPPAGANCGWWLQQHGYPQGLPYRPRPAVLPFPVKHEVTVPETPMAILQSHPERSSRHEPSQTVPLFLLSVRR